jgi:REP element-mobilizing transposase RayT
VENEWEHTEMIRPNVQIDTFMVMPNHLHGIFIVGAIHESPLQTFHSPSQTIGAIVRGFKSATTKQINQMRKMIGFPIWQRNYYEHIIRNDDELNRIREYIINNPINWGDDENYSK